MHPDALWVGLAWVTKGTMGRYWLGDKRRYVTWRVMNRVFINQMLHLVVFNRGYTVTWMGIIQYWGALLDYPISPCKMWLKTFPCHSSKIVYPKIVFIPGPKMEQTRSKRLTYRYNYVETALNHRKLTYKPNFHQAFRSAMLAFSEVLKFLL